MSIRHVANVNWMYVHTRARARTHVCNAKVKIDPFLLANSGQKAIESAKENRFIHFESAQRGNGMLYTFRSTMRIRERIDRMVAIVSDSSWLDKPARPSASRAHVCAIMHSGYRPLIIRQSKPFFCLSTQRLHTSRHSLLRWRINFEKLKRKKNSNFNIFTLHSEIQAEFLRVPVILILQNYVIVLLT